MMMRVPPVGAAFGMKQVFWAHAAAAGGVVRRQVSDIEKIVGRDAFEAELRRRGFRAVVNAGQYVIFCNREAIRLVE